MTENQVSIEQLKHLQKDANLEHTHLIYLSEDRFTIAHTDEERASGMNLEECSLHQTLLNEDGPFDLGYFVALPTVDETWLFQPWSNNVPR